MPEPVELPDDHQIEFAGRASTIRPRIIRALLRRYQSCWLPVQRFVNDSVLLRLLVKPAQRPHGDGNALPWPRFHNASYLDGKPRVPSSGAEMLKGLAAAHHEDAGFIRRESRDASNCLRLAFAGGQADVNRERLPGRVLHLCNWDL